jgi:hypothetical protein
VCVARLALLRWQPPGKRRGLRPAQYRKPAPGTNTLLIGYCWAVTGNIKRVIEAWSRYTRNPVHPSLETAAGENRSAHRAPPPPQGPWALKPLPKRVPATGISHCHHASATERSRVRLRDRIIPRIDSTPNPSVIRVMPVRRVRLAVACDPCVLSTVTTLCLVVLGRCCGHRLLVVTASGSFAARHLRRAAPRAAWVGALVGLARRDAEEYAASRCSAAAGRSRRERAPG